MVVGQIRQARLGVEPNFNKREVWKASRQKGASGNFLKSELKLATADVSLILAYGEGISKC
jgi:hypothetical protein